MFIVSKSTTFLTFVFQIKTSIERNNSTDLSSNDLRRHLETGDRLGASALQFPVHGQAHLRVDFQHRELTPVHNWHAGLQRAAQLGFAVFGKYVVTRTGSIDSDERQRKRKYLSEHGRRQRFDVLGRCEFLVNGDLGFPLQLAWTFDAVADVDCVVFYRDQAFCGRAGFDLCSFSAEIETGQRQDNNE